MSAGVGASRIYGRGSRTGPLASLYSCHCGQGVDDEQWVDHCDRTNNVSWFAQCFYTGHSYLDNGFGIVILIRSVV